MRKYWLTYQLIFIILFTLALVASYLFEDIFKGF